MCELLKTRRSVRKYRPEQVPDELLDAVLEAGLYAPSAMNNQKPVMVAVRDKATRDQLSRHERRRDGDGQGSLLRCALRHCRAG